MAIGRVDLPIAPLGDTDVSFLLLVLVMFVFIRFRVLRVNYLFLPFF